MNCARLRTHCHRSYISQVDVPRPLLSSHVALERQLSFRSSFDCPGKITLLQFPRANLVSRASKSREEIRFSNILISLFFYLLCYLNTHFSFLFAFDNVAWIVSLLSGIAIASALVSLSQLGGKGQQNSIRDSELQGHHKGDCWKPNTNVGTCL